MLSLYSSRLRGARARLGPVAVELAPVLVVWATAVAMAYGVHWVLLDRSLPFPLPLLSAAALPALAVALAPPRLTRAATVVCLTTIALLAVANAAYHRFMDRYLPLELIAAANGSLGNFAYVGEFLRGADLIVVGLLVAALIGLGFWRAPEHQRDRRHVIARFAIVCACVAGSLPAAHRAWANMSADPDAGNGGFLYSNLTDVIRLANGWLSSREPDSEQWQAVRSYLKGAEDRHGPSELHGKLAGTNLLIIKVESVNDWVVNAELGGRAVAPAIQQLAKRALRFREIYDATGAGRSSDADYMFFASQHAMGAGAIAIAYPRLDPTTLIHVLAQRGYASFVADAGPPTLWRARSRFQDYGFHQSRFAAPAANERFGYGMLDSVFLDRTAPAVTALASPFVASVHTLTTHGPHRNRGPWQSTLPLGSLQDSPLGIWLDKVSYTDRALSRFLSILESHDALSRTTIVLFGDHTESTGFAPDVVASLSGLASFDPTTREIRLRRIPVLIVPPPGVQIRGADIDAPGTLADLAPTLLDLMGLPVPPSFAGRSLLRNSRGWATSASAWVIGNDLAWIDGQCWDRRRFAGVADASCDSIRVPAAAEMSYSNLVSRFNLSREIDGRRVTLGKQ